MTKYNWHNRASTVIACACSLLFLYTAVFGQFVAIVQRTLLLMFGLTIVFLDIPMVKRKGLEWTRGIDYLLILLNAAICLYLIISWKSIVYRAGQPNSFEWILCVVLVLLLFEACRRTMGIAMPVISVVCLIYAFYGRYMPLAIAHRGFTPKQMLSTIFLTTEGIWGTALGVGSSVIVYFLIFTAFLSVTGANDAFLTLSNAMIGGVRGGPAKMAVVASSIFGTISGSAPANVASTGSITIPLMKKTGYNAEFAGAVEAVASSGGQLVPPVMGSAAFIMAEVLGIKYATVCRAAILPAVFYYVSIFAMVELEARKSNLAGLSKEQVPDFRESLKKWWPVLIPLFLLIGLLISQMTPSRAAFFALVALILVSFMRNETRLNIRKIIDALALGARDMAPITVICGVAGIIIGVLGRTGLGTKLAEVIVSVADGNLMIILILTMITSLIMGMGMPTVACYILLALSVAPAISKAGVPPLAAHMFVFYFGIISAITPPVAIASYTAAGIAKADVNKLSLWALKLGAPAFILPYMFVYGPELLMISGENLLLRVAVGALLGTLCMAVALHGYLWSPLNIFQRAMLFVSSLLLIYPSLITDVIGFALALCAFLWHRFDSSKTQQLSATGG